MHFSVLQTLYQFKFCLQFIRCLSASIVPVVIIVVIIIVVIVYIFTCFCKLSLWKKSKSQNAVTWYFTVTSMLHQVQRPIQNFQTSRFTALYLVYVGRLNELWDIRNACETSRKMPQSVKEWNAWRTIGIRFAALWPIDSWSQPVLSPHSMEVKQPEREADQS
jgi:hypothetical protein